VVLLTKDFLIVVADDDVDDREFLSQALRRNAFPGICKGLEDGETLINYLKQLKTPSAPGLIVLDLNMPLKNGYEVLAELKNEASLKNIPVVVLTSSQRAEDERLCYSLGCDKFYRKPGTLSGYDDLAESMVSYLRAL
jgi:CheY-like chemotaxis protein